MESKKQKELSDIIQKYNSHSGKLINIATHYMPDDPGIDWCKRVMKIVRNENPPMLIEKGCDKIWENREKILACDTEFFKKMPTDKYIKNDCRKEFIDEIVNIVRVKYSLLSEKEHDVIWHHIHEMLSCVIKYRLAKEDYM